MWYTVPSDYSQSAEPIYLYSSYKTATDQPRPAVKRDAQPVRRERRHGTYTPIACTTPVYM